MMHYRSMERKRSGPQKHGLLKDFLAKKSKRTEIMEKFNGNKIYRGTVTSQHDEETNLNTELIMRMVTGRK
jgi:hypothetical protein